LEFINSRNKKESIVEHKVSFRISVGGEGQEKMDSMDKFDALKDMMQKVGKKI
jgi:hypothetical protein